MVSNQLPDNTILFKFGAAGYDPSSLTTLTGATWTRISAEPNVWLWDASGVEIANWAQAFYKKFTSFNTTGYVDIIGAGELTIPIVIGQQIGSSSYYGMLKNNNNTLRSVCYLSFPNAELAQDLLSGNSSLLRTEGLNLPKATTFQSIFKGCINLDSIGSITSSPSLTNCRQLFYSCKKLTTVPLFDTSNVTNMQRMFYGCTSLTTVPLFNTSKVSDMDEAFIGCINVQSGALALYQQASTQSYPPTSHIDTFRGCGSNTITGAAELAQIPTSWGGTMA